MLIPNAQRQEYEVVSQPPNSGPSAAVPPIVAPQMPNATPRSRPRKFALSNDSEVGSMSAPPSPCTARAAISCVPSPASAASTLAPAKITVPSKKSRRRPYWSARRPPTSRSAAKTSV